MSIEIANSSFTKADLTLQPNLLDPLVKLLSSIHADLHTEDHKK